MDDGGGDVQVEEVADLQQQHVRMAVVVDDENAFDASPHALLLTALQTSIKTVWWHGKM